MYSITHPNSHGEPTIDLSSDDNISIHNKDELTGLQLKHHCVIKKLFSEYGINAPVTTKLCDILRCKLWRMGQKLSKTGANRYKILEGWKEGDSSIWELSIDCVAVNKELGTQILSNEKKINKLKQENSSLQAELNTAQQKLKEIQNVQTTLIKTNKRMASALVAGPNPKREKKDLSKVSRQQQWNRRKQVHSDITHALSFLESDGVQPLSVTLTTGSSTEVLDLQSGTYTKPKGIYTDALTDSPQLALYVKDRFGLSDTAYHELAMICEQLPRLSKLKKLAKNLNSQWEIKPCPENSGIQQSLKLRLITRIQHLLKGEKISVGEKLQVKLSGDGTKVCRKLNLINFTFTLLNEGALAMSPSGNHTIAIINGSEKYEHLETALRDVIAEVCELQTLTVNHYVFEIEYFLCSDLKFLAIICGIEAAMSNYSCVWCKCPSSQRYDMSKEWSFSDTENGARTNDDIISCCGKKPKSQKFGCIHPPLFQNIAIDHVIPDILHLYLRITDVLFNLLILDIRRYDAVTKYSNNGQPKENYLKQLEFFINNSCKIPLHFNEHKESKDLVWRDLTGPEKRVFFSKISLPELFPELPNVQAIEDLWNDFVRLESILHSESVSPEEAKSFGTDAKKWVQKFTSRYQSKNVTPYIHILSMHVPEFLLKYKNLVYFTQQGMEKLNDETTIDFTKSTNHNYHNLEALKQLMTKRNRIEHLQDSNCQRTPKQKICSICKKKGHNSRTCDKHA